MSKKDYVAIAAALREEFTLFDGNQSAFANTQRATVIAVAQRIALVLKSDNPHFDEERFLTATGIRG